MKRAALTVSLTVNGRQVTVEAEPATPLLYVLRNDLGLNGPKFGCGLGECGACAVLVDGRSARSCALPVGRLGARRIVTLEGLCADGRPGPVQAAFIRHQAAQCGYCLNGMIIAVTALAERVEEPDKQAIREALRHHLCRCGTHIEILAAAREAVALAREARAGPSGAKA